MADPLLLSAQFSGQDVVNGFSQLNARLDRLVEHSETISRGVQGAFRRNLSAEFFGRLGEDIVRSIYQSLSALPVRAVEIAVQTKNAFKGVASVAAFKGISASDVQETIKNLDIVKAGLLGVSEAATSYKNLLTFGYSLEQSTKIIQAFGDASAFGRQSSLSFSQAIASGTEGIKNNNNQLIDNTGLTKNVAVILKERGFQTEQLTDKVKGAAAKEALYQGILAETAAQTGDAARLANGYSGATSQLTTSIELLLGATGKLVTENGLVVAGLNVATTVVRFLTNNSSGYLAVLGTVVIAVGGLSATLAIYNALVNAAAIETAFLATTTGTYAKTALIAMRAQIAQMIPLMFSFTAATASASAAVLAIGGWLTVIAVVGALGYALYKYNQVVVDTEQVNLKVIRGLDEQVKSYQALEDETIKLARIEQSWGYATEQLTATTKRLSLESQTNIEIASQQATVYGIQRTQAQALVNEIDRLRQAKADELAIQLDLIGVGYQAAQVAADEAKALKQKNIELAKIQATDGAFSRTLSRLPFIEGKGAENSLSYAEDEAKERQKQIGFARNLVEIDKLGLRPLEESLKLQGYSGDALQRQLLIVRELVNEQNKLAGATSRYADALRKVTVPDGNLLNVPIGDFSVADAKVEQLRSRIRGNAFTDFFKKAAAGDQSFKDFSGYRKRAALENADAVKDILETIKKASSSAGEYDKKVKQIFGNKDDKFIYGLSGIVKQQDKINEGVDKELDKRDKVEKVVNRAAESYKRMVESLAAVNLQLSEIANPKSATFRILLATNQRQQILSLQQSIIQGRDELGLKQTTLPSNRETLQEILAKDDRVRQVKEAVKRAIDGEREARLQLDVAIRTLSIPVVSAELAANQKYVDSLHSRREAERDLTADLANELRQRGELSASYYKEAENAQASALTNLLRKEREGVSSLILAVAEGQAKQAGVSGLSGNGLLKEAKRIADKTGGENPLAAIKSTNQILETQIVTRLDKMINISRGIKEKDSTIVATSGGSSVTAKNSKGQALINAAATLGVSPVDLAAIISFETGGTNNPSAKNSIGYKGLLQFSPDYQKSNKIDFSSFENQVQTSVVKYFQERFKSKGLLNSDGTLSGGDLLTLYRTVIAGNPRANIDSKDINGTSAMSAFPEIAGAHTIAALAKFFSGSFARSGFSSTGGSISVNPDALDFDTGGGIPSTQRGRPTLGNAQSSAIFNEIFRLTGIRPRDYENRPDTIQAATSYVNQRTARIDSLAALKEKTAIEQKDLKYIQEIDEAERQANLTYKVKIENVRQLSALTQTYNALAVEGSNEQKDAIDAEIRSRQSARTSVKEQLIALRALNGEIGSNQQILDSLEKAEVSARQSREGLADDIVQTQYRIANAGEDAALRYKKAWLDAIEEVQGADQRAVESQIASQVRIADKSVFHVEQTKATILEYFASQKGITEVVSDNFISTTESITNAVDKGIGRLTKGLGIFGDSINKLYSDLTRLLLNRLILKFLDRIFPGFSGQGGASSGLKGVGGSGGGGGIGSFLGSLFGGGGGSQSSSIAPFLTGGFAGGNPAQAALFGIGGAGATPFNGTSSSQSGGLGTGSITDTAIAEFLKKTQGGSDILGGIPGAGSSVTRGISPALSAGILGAGLGIGLGASLGGTSRLGRTLGGIGGGLGGLIIGIGAQAGVFSGAAAFTTLGVVGLGIAAALLLASFFIGRSARRRQWETYRNQLSLDSFKALDDLLARAKRGDVTRAQAKVEFDAIRASYLEGANKITEKKTRNIAIKDVSRLDARFAEIDKYSQRGEAAQLFSQQIKPTFASGGSYSSGLESVGKVSSGLTPGQYRPNAEQYHGIFTGNEVILEPRQWSRIVPELSALKVPGFTGRSRPSSLPSFAYGGLYPTPNAPASSPSPMKQPDIHITAIMVADKQAGKTMADAMPNAVFINTIKQELNNGEELMTVIKKRLIRG